MCKGISKAWHDIPKEIVVRSFLGCSVSNSLDGSKEYFVYDCSSDNVSFEDNALLDKVFASTSKSDFEGF